MEGWLLNLFVCWNDLTALPVNEAGDLAAVLRVNEDAVRSEIRVSKHWPKKLAVVCDKTRDKSLIYPDGLEFASKGRHELICKAAECRILLPIRGFL